MKMRKSNQAGAVPDWVPLLAAAVVQQAIADVVDPSLPPAVRQDARRFLADIEACVGNGEFPLELLVRQR